MAAACLGRDALEVAAAHQFADEDPAHEQFYNYGRELVATLNALDDLTVTLTSQSLPLRAVYPRAATTVVPHGRLARATGAGSRCRWGG